MGSKKILFILSEYPPLTSPTALAASLVINEMAKKEEVYCLRIYDGSQKVNDPVQIFSLFPSKSNSAWSTSKIGTKLKRLIFRLRQTVLIPFYPIAHPVLQNKVNKLAIKICKKYNIDVVICVSFPFESIVAGNYIKRTLPQIKFVSYLIDAFACGTPPKYLPKVFSNRRRESYEKRMISNADLVIAMESGRDFYEGKKYAGNIKFLNPAFFDDAKVSLVPDQTNRFDCNNTTITIVYSGYLYLPDRDPTFIIKALSNVPQYRFRLQFVGRSEVNQVIEKEKKEINYEILCSGHVGHDELKQILNNANIFLHLGVSNSNAISGKIFEYMSYGKPIIALYFKDGEATLPYLNKYPFSCCIDMRKTSYEMAGKIIFDFINQCKGKTVPLNYVKEVFYTSTPEAFVHEIEMLGGE